MSQMTESNALREEEESLTFKIYGFNVKETLKMSE